MAKTLRLITDFDGPIMDVSERYYQVYQFCLAETKRPEQPVNLLTKDEFWRLKRAYVPEQQIGLISGLDPAQAKAFAQLRGRTVHTRPYLHYDTLAPGAVAALERIHQSDVDLAVMTMRRVWQLEEAFNRYGLGRFFPEDRCYCLNDDYAKTGDVNDKPPLMERALAELPVASQVWMVGDTEADITAARNYGVKVIAVLCGIRDRDQLKRHNPDLIVNDLGEAVDFVLGESLQETGSAA